MSFKLALKNIKKSIKDYSIYFFTLVMAVVIFYIFNSLGSQSSMMILNDSKYKIVESLIYVLGYVSVFVSIILGFLIVYSNNFLIKRRKKEFGIYLTLGMPKRKVSTILVIETFIVGIMSLIIGLVLGVFLSQILSVFTAKLFEADMTSYKFIFSSAALIKTVVYFGIIFFLVMIFNVFSLSKHKLIDLLTAKKKNEKVKFRNKYVIIITFILSIILIGYAYDKLLTGALVSLDASVVIMLLTGAIGTFLFFFSVSGFILKVFQLSKKAYYKNLNMFNIKQINSKINTSVVSTTVICLMLLLTICILSGSIALSSAYNGALEENNKTDFTIISYEYNCVVENPNEGCVFKKNETNIAKILSSDAFAKSVNSYAYYNIYEDENITMSAIIDEESKRQLRKDYGDTLEIDNQLSIISESDFNSILNLYKEKNIDIKDNEYLLTSNVEMATDMYKTSYESGNNLIINGYKLKPSTTEIYSISLQNYSGSSNFGTIVVSDEVVKGLLSEQNIILGNYIKEIDTEKEEYDFFDGIRVPGVGEFVYYSKTEMQNTSIGLKAILIFVGLYLGIIFAVSSATVLAISNLSASSDNKERYHILRQIGADEIMIKRSLFTQIFVSFMVPLAVALVHSYFGLKELSGIIKIMGDVDLTSNILITALFVIIVYGGYFLATYYVSRNIIKNENVK